MPAAEERKILVWENLLVGQELPPLKKRVSLDQMRLYSGWTIRNVHTDPATAKAAGLPAPIAQGLMSHAYLTEMLTGFFGASFLQGGKLSLAFVRYKLPGNTITAKGVIRDRIIEGDAVQFQVEVWCENEFGEKVTVGTAEAVVQSGGSPHTVPQ